MKMCLADLRRWLKDVEFEIEKNKKLKSYLENEITKQEKKLYDVGVFIR